MRVFPCVKGLEPGVVGLALSYAVTLTGMFQWGVRQSAEIENLVRTFTLFAAQNNAVCTWLAF